MSSHSNRRRVIRAINATVIASVTPAVTMLTVIVSDHRSVVCITAAILYKILDRILQWMTPEQFAAIIEAIAQLL